jgi:amphi-Trp domain-containing protein
LGKTELEFEQRVTVEQGATYLEEIAKGLRSGALELSAGKEKIRLSPAGIVKVLLEASSEDNKQKLALEVRWHVTDVRAMVEEPQLVVAAASSDHTDPASQAL